MLHRGIKFAHAATLMFSVVLAFLFVRDLDETMPLGDSALLWVNQSDNSRNGPASWLRTGYPEFKRRFRRDVLGYLLQNYALMENATVAANLAIAIKPQRRGKPRVDHP